MKTFSRGKIYLQSKKIKKYNDTIFNFSKIGLWDVKFFLAIPNNCSNV